MLHVWQNGHHSRSLRSKGTEISGRSEEHTSELQSQSNLVCRLLLEKQITIHRRPIDRPQQECRPPPRPSRQAVARQSHPPPPTSHSPPHRPHTLPPATAARRPLNPP